MRKLSKIIFSINFLYIVLIAAQIAAIIFLCLTLPSVMPLALTFMFIWIFNGITACVLFSRRGAPEVKCAWFVLITALPVAGALIYLFASVKKKPCGVLKVEKNNEKTPKTNQNCDNSSKNSLLYSLAAAAENTCGTALAGYDRAEYFSGGTEFFNAVCREIECAKKCVYVEFFIVGRGKIFNSFMTAVQKARENGAEVKLIIDGVGTAFRISRKELKRLKSSGIGVKIFHRLTPFPRARLNFRDHRKIVTVDGRVAFTGGFNLADQYANITSPYGYWKDTGVAVFGAAAKIFARIYAPMMKSTYAAAGIFAFMASWNNYMWPLIALQSNSKFTMPLAVANLAADFNPDYGMIMVGIVMSTIPTVIVFFCLQKAFVEGMVGSVK